MEKVRFVNFSGKSNPLFSQQTNWIRFQSRPDLQKKVNRVCATLCKMWADLPHIWRSHVVPLSHIGGLALVDPSRITSGCPCCTWPGCPLWPTCTFTWPPAPVRSPGVRVAQCPSFPNHFWVPSVPSLPLHWAMNLHSSYAITCILPRLMPFLVLACVEECSGL